MKIQNVPFGVTRWEDLEPTEHRGEEGVALWRTFEEGNLRVRVVEYSPGYRADHWCARGHVLYVLSGTLVTELKDGRVFTLTPGMSYQGEDDPENPHRSRTETGATLFIVD